MATLILTLHLSICVVGPPAAPALPTVVPINYTSIVISWTPPWMYPINNYTVAYTTAASTGHIDVSGDTTSTILHKDSVDECEEIAIRVRASTDVGTTEYSNATIGRFPSSKLGGRGGEEREKG